MTRLLEDWTRAGFIPMPLRGKVPAFKGWRTTDYSADSLNGHNIGFRLAADQLVIDCDPRNYAPHDEPLQGLSTAIGFDLYEAPTVYTGGGGMHYYYRKPQGLAIVGKLPEYPGIDFKSEGGFVVAPGSIHPDTGRAYAVDPDRPHISAIEMAPAGLLKLLARPTRAARTGGGGEIDNDQLARLLACLDAQDYVERADWIAISSACHDATGGDRDALSVWLDWCASDPNYDNADAWEKNEAAWASFKDGRENGATIGTLFHAVKLAGGEDVVRAIQSEIRDTESARMLAEPVDAETLASLRAVADAAAFGEPVFKTLNALRVSDRIKDIIERGELDGSKPRHRWRFQAIAALLDSPEPLGVILGVLINPAFGISEPFRGEHGRLKAVKEICDTAIWQKQQKARTRND